MKLLAALALSLTLTAQASPLDEQLQQHEWPKVHVTNVSETCFRLGFHLDQSTNECWLSSVQFDAFTLRKYIDLSRLKTLADDSCYSRVVLRFSDDRLQTYLLLPSSLRGMMIERAIHDDRLLSSLLVVIESYKERQFQ